MHEVEFGRRQGVPKGDLKKEIEHRTRGEVYGLNRGVVPFFVFVMFLAAFGNTMGGFPNM
jgi:hypothetical protein